VRRSGSAGCAAAATGQRASPRPPPAAARARPSPRRPPAAARPRHPTRRSPGSSVSTPCRRNSRRGLLLRAPDVDWGGSPPGFKRYPGASRVALPLPSARAGAGFDLAALGHVLWHVGAVTERRGGSSCARRRRSGALFPTELYVVCRSVDGVADGVWHYDAESHALESLGPAPVSPRSPDGAERSEARAPSCRVIATAVFRRSGYKYRDRTYRYVLADLGHALENLRVAATSIGLATRFVAGFDPARTAAIIGVDEAEEGVLAVALLAPRDLAAEPEQAREDASADPTPVPRAAAAAALGATAAIHALTSVRWPASSAATSAIAAGAAGTAPSPCRRRPLRRRSTGRA
jgi:SagB-type dehydrogenase family enzyme